jgi:hypothetical protein
MNNIEDFVNKNIETIIKEHKESGDIGIVPIPVFDNYVKTLKTSEERIDARIRFYYLILPEIIYKGMKNE